MASDLYFKQLPVGPMANFIYLIGSASKKECLVVDPAWDTDALIASAAADGMKIVGSLVTHYHPDHCGGGFMGFRVPGGVAELLGKVNAPAHVHKEEADGLRKVTGISKNDLVIHDSGDDVKVGDVSIKLVHTPGHTPGSQCFFVEDRLVSGDTLFVGACGRVDLPGGDREQMLESLTKRLLAFPDHVVLYPGHDYGRTPTSTLGQERKTNVYMRMNSVEDWLSLG
jgi:glyoxylase-like metal-dependent hydrolase (beta-lactamase superfamily II)